MSVQSVVLGSVAQINPALGVVNLNDDDLVDFVPMAAVDAYCSESAAQEFRPFDAVKRGYTSFQNGDVLLAKITPCFENGKISQIRTRAGIGFGSTEFHVIRADATALDPRYLVHFLRQDQIRIEGERRMTGSGGQRRVPKSFLEALHIFLPMLDEQRRIAAILDQADALRAQRREALAQLDSLTQAIFIEMFGDPEKNPLKWDIRFLSEVAIFENGDRSVNYPSGDDIKREGVLFLNTKNIVSNRLNLASSAFISAEKYASLSRGKARPNDLIITLRGTLGSCCIFDCKYDDAFINAQLMIIRPSAAIDGVYLHALLTSRHIQWHFSHIGRGAAVPQLTSAQLAELKIAVPPIERQQAFSARIQAVEALKATHRTALAEIDALFAALQHSAFTGAL